MRRRMLLALAGSVLAGAVAFALWPRPDRVTWENYDRIKAGMTRAEVEAFLGAPGDYRTRLTGRPELGTLRRHTFDEAEAARDEKDLWKGDTGNIVVSYGCSGTTTEALYYEVDRPGQRPLDNLLWRLRRQWRKWFPEPPSYPPIESPSIGPDEP